MLEGRAETLKGTRVREFLRSQSTPAGLTDWMLPGWAMELTDPSVEAGADGWECVGSREREQKRVVSPGLTCTVIRDGNAITGHSRQTQAGERR